MIESVSLALEGCETLEGDDLRAALSAAKVLPLPGEGVYAPVLARLSRHPLGTGFARLVIDPAVDLVTNARICLTPLLAYLATHRALVSDGLPLLAIVLSLGRYAWHVGHEAHLPWLQISM
jgi:hypothetical protein